MHRNTTQCITIHATSLQYISLHHNIYHFITIFITSSQYLSLHHNTYHCITILITSLQYLSLHHNTNECIINILITICCPFFAGLQMQFSWRSATFHIFETSSWISFYFFPSFLAIFIVYHGANKQLNNRTFRLVVLSSFVFASNNCYWLK